MKRISLLIPFCSALLLAGACQKDKTDEKSEEVAAAAKASEATASAAAPTEQAADEASCAGAEGKAAGEHDGMDCMKKTAAMEEAGEGMGCNQWNDAADKVAQRDIPTDADWNVLSVTGMSCGGCERRIIANVGALEGVVSVEADAELGKVRVAVAKGNTTAGDAAKAKIKALGYRIQ